jgi:hypothetical protein
MNWEALGALAELLGAVGVIVTLLYLASQIKQSFKDTRADALQQLSRDYANHTSTVMSDENVGAFIKGLTSYASLEPEERLKFDICAAGFVNLVENTIYHNEAGRLDEVLTMLEGYLGPRLFAYPGFREWWEQDEERGFADVTQEWVDRQITARESGARFWHYSD